MTQYPNWFTPYAQPLFEKYLTPLAGQPGLRFLQIGAFTGDASLWMLENILTGDRSKLVDVDTWAGSNEHEHEAFDWADVERVYDERTQGYRSTDYMHPGRLKKCKASSWEFFERRYYPFLYDFVYIDGDHTAVGVLEDGVQAIQFAKPGGLFAFDDYLWKPRRGKDDGPGKAIDALRDIYADRLTTLELGAQAWFQVTE